MQLTNKYGLPQPFVDAVSVDDYKRGAADFTTTELIKPVRIAAFTRKYFDEVVEDVSDRVWMLFGQAKHVILERIARRNPERYVVEQRFSTKLGEYEISGQVDLYDNHTRILYDWKDNSVYKFILGDTREWEEQGNINAYLMRAWNYEVKALVNITFLKDWKAREARVKKDYPKCAIHVVPLPLWAVGQQQAFILERARKQVEERDNPPVCSEKERWERPASIALMKKGTKRARKLYEDHQQAYAALADAEKRAKPGEKFFLEQRPNEPVRCLDHCAVRKFCDFGIEAARKWREQQDE